MDLFTLSTKVEARDAAVASSAKIMAATCCDSKQDITA
jgi:hypothetical protein